MGQSAARLVRRPARAAAATTRQRSRIDRGDAAAAPGADVREVLLDTIWAAGVRAFHLSKRFGGLARGERLLQVISNRVMPQPGAPSIARVGGGAKLFLPGRTPRARTYRRGMYEPEVTRAVTRILADGATFVDLGANIGYYSILAASLVGGAGRVYAFEPLTRCYRSLLTSMELNGFDNVVALDKAVSDGMGTALLLHRLDNIDGSSLARQPALGAFGEQVETTTLDAYFEQKGWPKVDLIKMDIEGSELAALRGMEQLSRRNPQLKLIMELARVNLERLGGTIEELRDVLVARGFREGLVLEQNDRRFRLPDGFPTTRTNYNLLMWK